MKEKCIYLQKQQKTDKILRKSSQLLEERVAILLNKVTEKEDIPKTFYADTH